jgi:hypothetical protein
MNMSRRPGRPAVTVSTRPRPEVSPRMTVRSSRLALASLTLAAITALAACGGSGSATSLAPSTAASAAPSVAASAGTSAPGASAGAVTKVSANTASNDELVAALTAANVPNASRWAREISEYRPYDASDATLQELQDNLAKYNPDPATLAAILSVLQP